MSFEITLSIILKFLNLMFVFLNVERSIKYIYIYRYMMHKYVVLEILLFIYLKSKTNYVMF